MLHQKHAAHYLNADLWDTVGFNEPGGLQVYGLELMAEGNYTRAPITPLLSVMYLIQYDMKSRMPILLVPALNNQEGGMEVILDEICYCLSWNISKKLDNNWVINKVQKIIIPDEYYK